MFEGSLAVDTVCPNCLRSMTYKALAVQNVRAYHFYSNYVRRKLHASKKRLSDKKTCRWVLDNGTICGRTFSKFDSLRRHVQELHKGVRPFVCHMCEKSYGRRDYLDRHMKSHTAGGSLVDTSGASDDANDVKLAISGDDATLNEVVTVVSADDDLTV